jgi:TRAP-type mannitol/chloroaromatic compound transport system permease small subunit
MYNRLFTIAERLSQVAIWAAGAMMIFVAFMVTFDVLIRNIFDVTLGGADEISGYLFAIATAWSLPYALIHRANVRIDSLYIVLPKALRAVLDLFGLTLLALFLGILTWRALALLLDSYATGALSVTPLHVPITLPQAFWCIGLVLLCSCLVLLLYGTISALFRGDLKRVHQLVGAPSIQEEFVEEGLEIKRQET